MCGPFCSVPPVGMMTVVLPAAMASRTSIQVKSSRKTLSLCGTDGACAADIGSRYARATSRRTLTARMALLLDCWRPASQPDVLVPDRGVLADEPLHHLDAAGVLEHFHGHAAVPQEIFLAAEGDVLADHDAWDAVQQDRPRAHRAWGQGRVQDAPGIHRRRAPAGVLQGIHLAVEDGAAALHAPVVPPADDPALVNEDGADRHAPLGQPGLGFGDGGLQEFVHRLR